MRGPLSLGTALSPRQRLAFALDYPTLPEARAGAERVCGHVGVLKVGLELFVREGPGAVQLGRELDAQIFLDLKLHDIPETVGRAVARAGELGVRYLTVHAAGGPRMLAAAERAARGSGVELLAVTVLTSLDAPELAAVGVDAAPAAQVERLGLLARDVGIRGLVCSAEEVKHLRQVLGADALLVTPGIRPAGAEPGDQKRVATPEAALAAGASILVVGRPIREAPDPGAVARELAEAIGRAG